MRPQGLLLDKPNGLGLLLSTVQTPASRLEIDGKQYRHSGEDLTDVAYQQSKTWIENVKGRGPRVLLDDQWRSVAGNKPLKLTVGLHNISYGWAGFYPKKDKLTETDNYRPVVLWSNRVNIEVVAEDEGEGTGASVESEQDAADTTAHPTDNKKAAAGAGDVVRKWLARIKRGAKDEAAQLMVRGKNKNADDVLSMSVLLEAAAQGSVTTKQSHGHPTVALVVSKPLAEGKYVGQSFVFHLNRNIFWGPGWRIYEVSLLKPEELAAQLEAFRAKPVNRPVGPLGFGPVVERELRRGPEHTTALDLNANRLIQVPNDFGTNREVTQDPIKWLAVRGIDILPQRKPNRASELGDLFGFFKKVSQVENEQWDALDAAQVRKLLASVQQSRPMAPLPATEGSYPRSYVFESLPHPTGESQQGILQVLAVDQKEQAVKVRYKLTGDLAKIIR